MAKRCVAEHTMSFLCKSVPTDELCRTTSFEVEERVPIRADVLCWSSRSREQRFAVKLDITSILICFVLANSGLDPYQTSLGPHRMKDFNT